MNISNLAGFRLLKKLPPTQTLAWAVYTTLRSDLKGVHRQSQNICKTIVLYHIYNNTILSHHCDMHALYTISPVSDSKHIF